MPYIGKFVGRADAVQEIARVHFDDDTEKADANLRLALRDGVVSALSEKSGVGTLSVEDFPKFLVSAHHWKADRSLLNDTSWRGDCVFRRADLQKIYPGLWETIELGQRDSYGSGYIDDSVALEEMRKLVDAGKTHHAAARTLVDQVDGASDEAKVKRLTRKFKKLDT